MELNQSLPSQFEEQSDPVHSGFFVPLRGLSMRHKL
jgi:hypothetical protein